MKQRKLWRGKFGYNPLLLIEAAFDSIIDGIWIRKHEEERAVYKQEDLEKVIIFAAQKHKGQKRNWQ